MQGIDLAILIVILGLMFDYTNGFHDAANVVSTVVATRVLTPLAAIILAGILNTIGATQVSNVAKTIISGLVDPISASPYMILSAVIGAIFWNLLTWYFGIPSSSSYALVGGLVGAAWFSNGIEAVLWGGVLAKVIIPMIISPIVGFILAFCFMKILYSMDTSEKKVGKLFRRLQIGSASIVALSHGLNDAQKSMGLITLGLIATGFLQTMSVPLWVILSCAVVMGLGTASGGFRIIRTMGFEITKLEPVQGFAAELGASAVILAASYLGMPISSTHMIAGSITGVGVAKGRKAVKWGVTHAIIVAMVFTLPGAGLVAALFYKLISVIF